MILALGVRVSKPLIIKAVVKEFVARGLDKVHAKEIAEWQKYYRERKYASELDEEFMDEVERFEEDIKRWKPKELEELIIEGLDCLEPHPPRKPLQL